MYKNVLRSRQLRGEMDYFDEDDTKTRIVFRSTSSRPASSNLANPEVAKLNKAHAISLIGSAVLLLVFSVFYVETEPSKSLLLWISLSLFIGPFAPSRITGGNIRVGEGTVLDPWEEESEENEETHETVEEKRSARRRSRSAKVNQPVNAIDSVVPIDTGTVSPITVSKIEHSTSYGDRSSAEDVPETEWSEDDFLILKKQMTKNPAGKPGRWEAIAQAFNGRHKVETIVKMAKELPGLKSGNDDYEKFLKNRKDVDSRVQAENESSGGWSSNEDVALLNALKAFPKDTPMRWEKIAAAVPGQSKPACMKRFAELKKNFRNSKSNTQLPISD